MTEQNKLNIFYISFVIAPLPGFASDMIAPCLPAIHHEYHSSIFLIKAIIFTYLLGGSFGALISGPFLDSVGRKRITEATLLIFAACCIGITLDVNIYLLLFLRFIMAFCISIAGSAARASIIDVYTGRTYMKYMSYRNAFQTVSPILGPVIGAYLQYHFYWQMNFYFLAAYSFCMFFIINFLFYETLQHKHSMNLKIVLHDMFHMIKNPMFYWAVSFMGLITTIIPIFATKGSFYIQKVLGYSVKDFGHFFLILGVVYILGQFTHIKTLDHNKILKFTISSILILLGAAIMILCSIFNMDNIFSVMIPMIIIIYASSLIFPLIFIRTIALDQTKTATCSALVVGANLLIASLGTALASKFETYSLFSMAAGYLIISILSTLFLLLYRFSDLSEDFWQ